MTIIAQLTDLRVCAPGKLACSRADTMAYLLAAVDHLSPLGSMALSSPAT